MACESMNVMLSSAVFCGSMIAATKIFKVKKNIPTILLVGVAVFLLTYIIFENTCPFVESLKLIRISFVNSVLCVGVSIFLSNIGNNKGGER
jgi:hypothetical protein